MILEIDEGNDGSIEYTFAAPNASTVGGLGGPGHGIGTFNDQVYDNWQINDGCGLGTGPVLTKSGSCPGPITLTITGATANGKVAVACGQAGAFARSTPPCIGVMLGVTPPAKTVILTADRAGTAVLNFNAPPGVCGCSVQSVDVATCAPTNVIVL